MGKFLDHVATHRLAGCFALTLLGLRREEVGGLRWSDLDLDTGALRIRQARVDVNGRDMIVPTKTDRSARDLPLPPRELAMVKAGQRVRTNGPGRGSPSKTRKPTRTLVRAGFLRWS